MIAPALARATAAQSLDDVVFLLLAHLSFILLYLISSVWLGSAKYHGKRFRAPGFGGIMAVLVAYFVHHPEGERVPFLLTDDQPAWVYCGVQFFYFACWYFSYLPTDRIHPDFWSDLGVMLRAATPLIGASMLGVLWVEVVKKLTCNGFL